MRAATAPSPIDADPANRLSTIGRRSKALARQLARPADLQQRNIRNVLIDGIGVGLVSGVATFLSVFLVRLGASSFMVGLLTSMPALTGMLLALSIGRLLERQRNIVPWYSRARVLVLGLYALAGLVPFVVPAGQVPIVISLQDLGNRHRAAGDCECGLHGGDGRSGRPRSALLPDEPALVDPGAYYRHHGSAGRLGARADPLPAQLPVVLIGSFAGGLLSFIFSSQISIPDNQPAEIAEQTRHSRRERLREAWRRCARTRRSAAS